MELSKKRKAAKLQAQSESGEPEILQDAQNAVRGAAVKGESESIAEANAAAKEQMTQDPEEKPQAQKAAGQGTGRERPALPAKRVRIAIALLVLLLVGGGIWLGTGHGLPGQGIKLKGSVEAEMMPHYTEVSGKIVQVTAELGQQVEEGDVLARIDDTALQYSAAQLEQMLIQKQVALEQAKTGAGSARVQQAQDNYRSAEAVRSSAEELYHKAQADYTAAKALYDEGALSRSDLRVAETAMNTAAGSMNSAAAAADSARQQITIAAAASDTFAITSAQAAVDQAQSQLDQVKEQIEKCTIKAGCSGIVMSVSYSQGAVAAVGYDLFDISDAEEIYVLAYLPEKYMDRVSWGDTVMIRVGGSEYEGQLCYIDVKAQYTPSDYQTAASRNRDSFKIKVCFDAAEAPLKPGQEAFVIL